MCTYGHTVVFAFMYKYVYSGMWCVCVCVRVCMYACMYVCMLPQYATVCYISILLAATTSIPIRDTTKSGSQKTRLPVIGQRGQYGFQWCRWWYSAVRDSLPHPGWLPSVLCFLQRPSEDWKQAWNRDNGQWVYRGRWYLVCWEGAV